MALGPSLAKSQWLQTFPHVSHSNRKHGPTVNQRKESNSFLPGEVPDFVALGSYTIQRGLFLKRKQYKNILPLQILPKLMSKETSLGASRSLC